MKRIVSCLVFLLLLFSMLSGCGETKEEVVKAAKNEYILYYLSSDSMSFVPKAAHFDKKKSTEEQIKTMLTKLTELHNETDYRTVLPDYVILQKYTLGDNHVITLDFSATYYETAVSSQVLCRAAFVKSLVQIPGVDAVEFTVDTQPMVDGNSLVGALTPDAFVDSDTKDDSNMVQNLTIYFTDVTGEKLEPLQIPVNLGTNASAEELVIRELIKGTDEKGYYNTMPKGTKLFSVSTQDGICYVDLNEDFLKVPKSVKDQVVIYSIVNSLCELSTVSKVAFTIEGETKKLYNGNVPFDQLFERNLDLVDTE